MLRFEVRELHLESMGRYLLPLPKLNSEQIRFLARHLGERGFSVSTDARVHARKGLTRISIDQVGLAWSSESQLDAIAPAVPELLHFAKEHVSSNPYFDARKVDNGLAVRLVTRMESSSLWVRLREAGKSGLTPDEALMIRELLRGVGGRVECVTDYPTDGGFAFQIGRRSYYRSRVPTAEFGANLRTISSEPQKGCYLPKQSALLIRTEYQIPAGLPKQLGEWCFLDA